MAFRFYSVMFALGTSLLGLVTPPNLHFVNAQVQMNKDSKAEVDRLLDLCRKDLMTQKFQEALQSCQQAATNFKAM